MFKENEMDSSDERPVPPTSERLHVDLRRLDWAKGLSEETLTAITNTAEWVEFHAGEVVLEVESEITHVYFLITGRVQSTLYDSLGKEIQKDTIVPRVCHWIDCPRFIGSLSSCTSRLLSLRQQYD